MKTKLLMLIFLASTLMISAQDSSNSMSLTVDEAQEHALMHNKMIKSSKLDIEASKMSTWEALSGGLPKVDGSASLTDNLKLMTQLLPGEFFGQPGVKIPVQFGSQFNTSYGVTVSQLIFNASYLVGVQTAKLAENLSVEALEKSELDIKESVAATYYLILVSEESIKVLDDNIENMGEVLKSTRAMFEVGMAEASDVDQMQSNITMIENSRRSMERNVEVSYNLLRFQLGLDPEAEISLSQTLDDMVEIVNINILSMQEFNLQNNIDFRMLTSQEKLGELTVKMQKAAVLPSLGGFYAYTKSGMGDQLNDLQWFPNSMVGLQLTVPIFASGQRYSKIRKAEIDLEKVRNNKSLVVDQLQLQVKQMRFDLINANEQYESQKNNIEVASRVYNSVENKYKQGVASSLDLTQAQGNYLDAESSYISSLMNLLQSKLALDKLLNNL